MRARTDSSVDRKDAEIISEFMEPATGFRADWWHLETPNSEWLPILAACNHIELLGRIHLVENRLSEKQRLGYWLELSKGGSPEAGYWRIAHASARQKAKALVAVIKERSEAIVMNAQKPHQNPNSPFCCA